MFHKKSKVYGSSLTIIWAIYGSVYDQPETIFGTFSFLRDNSKLGERLRKMDKLVATLQLNLVS